MQHLKLTVKNLIANPGTSFFSRAVLCLLSFFPPVRAAILFKRGEIARPLKLLRLATFGIPSAIALKSRLEEMQQYLMSDGFEKYCNEAPSLKYKKFNGVVLFAFHSCGYFHPSGYASRSISILNSLARIGVRGLPITRLGYPWDISSGRAVPDTYSIEFEGHVFELKADKVYNLGSAETGYIDEYANWIFKRATSGNASVCHASSNYLNGLAVAQASRQLGVPSVYELRGLWHITRAFSDPDYENTEHYRYVERREVEACLAVDHVITLSSAMKDWLVLRGVPSDKVSIVGNATHKLPYMDDTQQRNRIRERYGIADDAVVIGYIGSLVEYEGLDLLVKGLVRVPESRRPLIFILGSGKAQVGLQRLAEHLQVTDYVVFGGRIPADEVSAHYLAMDFVALPRRDHTLTRMVPAIKPYEAAGHGRRLLVSPALATAIKGSMDDESYEIIDFESPECLNDLLINKISTRAGSVPTWDDRAHHLKKIYNRLYCNDHSARSAGQ